MPASSGTATVYAVLGHPVAHSLSPLMHTAAFGELGLDAAYVAFDVWPESLSGAIQGVRALGLAGVNITIPHKLAVLLHMDALTDEATFLDSVNTVTNASGRLIGDNTDGPGLMAALAASEVGVRGCRVLCVGAGGVARTSVLTLLRAGAAHVTVACRNESRFAEIGGAAAERGLGARCTFVPLADAGATTRAAHSADLVLQTTPIGMRGFADQGLPLPPAAILARHVVYDLVYRPLVTPLLRLARDRGCRVLDGVTLFVWQGAMSLRTWTGLEPPTRAMEKCVRGFLADEEGEAL